MKVYGYHRNLAARQDLDIAAGEGDWCIYAPVALSVQRDQKENLTS
jgi:hypothetical protein